jgi:hypothetical protein
MISHGVDAFQLVSGEERLARRNENGTINKDNNVAQRAVFIGSTLHQN